MIRIAHLCRVCKPGIGGMEESVHRLAQAQQQLGHEVRVLCPKVRSPTIEQVPYERVSACTLGPALQPVDVVHVHGVDRWLWRAKQHHRVVGVSTHGGFFHHKQGPLRQAYLHTVARHLLSNTAVWWTSPSDQRRFKSLRIAGAVLGDPFVGPFPKHKPKKGLVGVFGRVDQHKGHLRAIEWTAKTSGALRLQFVGPISTNDRRRLCGAAQRQGVALQVVGAVGREEFYQRMSVCSLVLFPSYYEGFAMTLVEAMAAGYPIAASDQQVHRWHLRGSGRLVNPKAPRPLAHLLNNPGPTQLLVKRASRWSAQGVARRSIELYRRIL